MTTELPTADLLPRRPYEPSQPGVDHHPAEGQQRYDVRQAPRCFRARQDEQQEAREHEADSNEAGCKPEGEPVRGPAVARCKGGPATGEDRRSYAERHHESAIASKRPAVGLRAVTGHQEG